MSADQNNEFFDPASCDCSLGGQVLDGFADGTMIEISPEQDDYEVKSGTKGAVGVVRKHSRIRMVKLRFLKTSASNTRLSTLRTSGRRAGAKGFAAQFDFRDGSGDSKLSGKAFVKTAPTQAFSNTADAWEWTLFVIVSSEDDEVIGGNSSFA